MGKLTISMAGIFIVQALLRNLRQISDEAWPPPEVTSAHAFLTFGAWVISRVLRRDETHWEWLNALSFTWKWRNLQPRWHRIIFFWRDRRLAIFFPCGTKTWIGLPHKMSKLLLHGATPSPSLSMMSPAFFEVDCRIVYSLVNSQILISFHLALSRNEGILGNCHQNCWQMALRNLVSLDILFCSSHIGPSHLRSALISSFRLRRPPRRFIAVVNVPGIIGKDQATDGLASNF